MRRTSKITLISALLILTLPLLGEAETKDEGIFSGSGHKNAYEYYMEKGEGHLDENQLEYALNSFQKALILKPGSEDARFKVALVQEKINSREDPRIVRARKRAIERAAKEAEQEAFFH